MSDRLQKILIEQLIEAQNKYDEYKVRYRNFCNKEHWDDDYDNICQNAMSVYLSKLLQNVEDIHKLLNDLDKDDNYFNGAAVGQIKNISTPNGEYKPLMNKGKFIRYIKID